MAEMIAATDIMVAPDGDLILMVDIARDRRDRRRSLLTVSSSVLKNNSPIFKQWFEGTPSHPPRYKTKGSQPITIELKGDYAGGVEVLCRVLHGSHGPDAPAPYDLFRAAHTADKYGFAHCLDQVAKGWLQGMKQAAHDTSDSLSLAAVSYYLRLPQPFKFWSGRASLLYNKEISIGFFLNNPGRRFLESMDRALEEKRMHAHPGETSWKRLGLCLSCFEKTIFAKSVLYYDLVPGPNCDCGEEE